MTPRITVLLPRNNRKQEGINPGGNPPIFHGPEIDRPTMTDPAISSSALLAGRYANIPIAVAVGLLMMTPVFGSSPFWSSLAGIILAAALALSVSCR